jgi:integrase
VAYRKVVLYVARRTYGFRRTSDRISVAQMSMNHGSFSTTMKYYTGVPADLQKQPAEVL